ncbi:MAG: response regulator [Candidatus Nitrosopolaris sp.]
MIGEDDKDTALYYKVALDERNHQVELLLLFIDRNWEILLTESNLQSIIAIDAVILDHKMPKMNGIEVAKEIVKIKPKQRIIISSVYLRDVLFHSIKELDKLLELMHKRFDLHTLIDTSENKLFYSELQRLNQDGAITQECI